ncbi:MAG: excisionase family DNA binding protein [Desulforhopalus sp.]|jgi:excisionase family DNA binding protein
MQKILLNYELPDLVSVPEAAKYLGVGRRIIYQLLEFNELRAIRERGKILIDPCSLKEFRAMGKMV